MHQSSYKDHIQLHFIVFLFGFTAILGKLIELPAATIVTYRMFIAFLGLLIWNHIKKQNTISSSHLFQALGIGVVVGFHWLTFFWSIQVSNVSVALGCLASSTLIIAILEPITEKRRISGLEIGLGIGVIFGLYLITKFAFQFKFGIFLAIISALLASVFTLLNKHMIRKTTVNSEVLIQYEMLSGAVLFFFYSFIFSDQLEIIIPSQSDLFYLIILGLICTSYAFVGTVVLLKKLSAFYISLAINLEPVYGIILAIILFQEHQSLAAGFYYGVLILLSVVLIYPVLKRYQKNSNQ